MLGVPLDPGHFGALLSGGATGSTLSAIKSPTISAGPTTREAAMQATITEADPLEKIGHAARQPRYSTLPVRRKTPRPRMCTRNPTGPARNVSTSATLLSSHGSPSLTLSRAIQAPTTMSNTR